MNCPKCGCTRTRVLNTATPGRDTRATHGLIAKAVSVIGWWDPVDLRARRRCCLRKSCGRRFDTVEVEVGSLGDAIGDAKRQPLADGPKGLTFSGMVTAPGSPAREL
jgi:hypothetical protein